MSNQRYPRYFLHFLLLALSGLTVSGCATRPIVNNATPEQFLHDSAFPDSRKYHVESREEVFQLDEQVKQLLDKKAGHLHSSYDNSMFIAGQIMQSVKGFAYNGEANTTAAQTYHRKMANCLSMTIMAYAMAQYLGFDTEFQIVHIPEYWEWRSHNSLVARHVNLVLKPPRKNGTISLGRPIVIDFFVPGSSGRYGSNTIADSTVLAMFYNNKGAEALLAGKHDMAYAYLRAALLKDPALGMVLSNLALLYIQEGKLHWAEQSFRESLAINPDDTIPAEGLANILKIYGQDQEAAKLLENVRHKRKSNPYYQYVRGEEEYAAGNWHGAILAFENAIKLRSDIDLPYFGLAKTYYQMGDYEKSESYLQRAERYANSEEAKTRYKSKIALLSSL